MGFLNNFVGMSRSLRIASKDIPCLKNKHVKKTLKTRTEVASVRRRPKKPIPCKRVDINDVVLFKMRGFCEWPARVIAIEKNIVEVKFFGDYTTQKSVLGENIFKFEDSMEIILFNLKNRQTAAYGKAIREAEILLGVPEQHSILNKIDSGI